MTLAEILHTLIDLAPIREESTVRRLHSSVDAELPANVHVAESDVTDEGPDAVKGKKA